MSEVFESRENWTPEQIEEWQRVWDSLAPHTEPADFTGLLSILKAGDAE